MDVQLDNLIERLKKEGVESAQQESDKILNEAKSSADEIIKKANEDVKKIISDAKKQAEDFRNNAESTIKQASRDLILVVKEKITALFEKSLMNKVQESLSPDFLKNLILKSTEQIGKNKPVELIVGKQDEEQMKSLLQDGIKKQLSNEIELKVDNKVTKGFRIGIKGEDVYYDFTDESIVNSLKIYLNTILSKLLEDKK